MPYGILILSSNRLIVLLWCCFEIIKFNIIIFCYIMHFISESIR